MQQVMSERQTKFSSTFSPSGRWPLIIAGLAAGIAALSLVFIGSPAPREKLPAPPLSRETQARSVEAGVRVESTRMPRRVSVGGITPRPAAPLAPLPGIEATAAELEQRFRATRDLPAQLDLLDEIAGRNDDEAVRVIGRLFPSARHPELKETLIAKLADIDPEAAPEERFRILDSALRNQPRNVRSAAIDVLAQSDEPQALALLRRSAREDPDRPLREAAGEILRVVEEGK